MRHLITLLAHRRPGTQEPEGRDGQHQVRRDDPQIAQAPHVAEQAVAAVEQGGVQHHVSYADPVENRGDCIDQEKGNERAVNGGDDLDRCLVLIGNGLHGRARRVKQHAHADGQCEPDQGHEHGRHPGPVELADPRVGREGAVAVAQIVEDVAIEPAAGERREQTEAEERHQPAEDHRDEGTPGRSLEIEADVAVARHPGGEA